MKNLFVQHLIDKRHEINDYLCYTALLVGVYDNKVLFTTKNNISFQLNINDDMDNVLNKHIEINDLYYRYCRYYKIKDILS